eukprot:gb/GFBE01053656.1/.p1 GENE.gb/GFBE01053656.1/~~gb/GFBE01053656.1/.p1  ORF type:complete len:112 (+),score=27.83 gb/GFBE01053656.1/:1-336(+)
MSSSDAADCGDIVLHVAGVDGQIGVVVANEHMTVLQVKRKVQDELGVPFLEQHLILGTTELKDFAELGSQLSSSQSSPATTPRRAELDLTLVRTEPPEENKWLDRDAWNWR